MHFLARAALRSPALRRPTAFTALAHARPQRLTHPPMVLAALQQKRGAASNVSGRPGSQSLGQAAQNIKEEVGDSAADVARSIAGGNMTSDSVSPSERTFLGVTSAVASSVPQPYIVFGLAGGLPYLFASGTTVYSAYQAGLAAQGLVPQLDFNTASQILVHALNVQATYGAVMLSFLGALHWGMEFAGYGGQKGYARLALGAAPVAYAWPTLLLDPAGALIAQWLGFTALWYADLKATGAGWAPKWYSQYRFYLSILVGTCIIGSLAGTSYFGPVAGHGQRAYDLNKIRAGRKEAQLESAGTIPGDIEALPAGEEGDAYVIVKKKEAPKEEDDSDAESEKKEGDSDEKSEEKKDGEQGDDKKGKEEKK